MEDTFKTRLTVELVPSSCWFDNVRTAVSGEEWDRLKKIVYREAGYRCQVCGGSGPQWPVEAHEIWHYDDASHTQTLLGLIALCPSCHQVKHIGLADVRGQGQQARAHLARVNGWSAEDAALYVEVQYEIWAQRSRHAWSLDVRWLERHGISISPTAPAQRQRRK